MPDSVEPEEQAILALATGVMAGKSLSEMEAAFRESTGRKFRPSEVDVAIGYVIKFRVELLRESSEDVAHLCLQAGLPITWEDAIEIADAFRSEIVPQ